MGEPSGEDIPTSPPAATPVTLREVARRAGVHVGTASRALNPASQALVSDATVRKVMAAAQELDYRPNAIARGLKTSRSMLVGILLPDLTNPLFPPITRGIEDALIAAGYTAVIANTDNDPRREARQLAALRSRQVDGFIVATALRSDPQLAELSEQRVPIVLVNRRVESLPIPAVTGDDQSGVEQAVRHLARLGHRRIAHLAGPGNTSTGHGRRRAFKQAVEDAGLAADPALIVPSGSFTEAAGAAALDVLLDSGAEFSAVVAGNDLIALGCYDVMERRGLSCPGDLSLIGFNDMPFIDKLKPPLTTVRVPHTAIGAEAARLLLQRITDPAAPPKSVTFPVTLIERGSTARPG